MSRPTILYLRCPQSSNMEYIPDYSQGSLCLRHLRNLRNLRNFGLEIFPISLTLVVFAAQSQTALIALSFMKTKGRLIRICLDIIVPSHLTGSH